MKKTESTKAITAYRDTMETIAIKGAVPTIRR